MKTQERIFQHYKRIHGDFLENNPQGRQSFMNNLFTHSYLPHIENKKTGKILEIGCGKGYMINALRSNGFQNIEGIDMSPDDVKIAKKLTSIDKIYCADAFRYLEQNRGYDAIIAKDIMEHVNKDKQEEFVRFLFESLNVGGVALVQVPNMDWLFSNHERYMDFTHEIGYTKESFADIFRMFFDANKVIVVPVSYTFTETCTKKNKIIYKFLRPIIIRVLRFLFFVAIEGSQGVWFEYKEILAVAQK